MEDTTLPKATVQKLLRDILPQDVKCSPETVDLILDCCVEFVHLIASEANEIANNESKKCINPQHILQALDGLGFKEYIDSVTQVLDQEKQIEKQMKQKWNKFSEKSEEDLLKEQQALFAKARSSLQAKQNESLG